MFRNPKYLEKTEYVKINLETPIEFPGNNQYKKKQVTNSQWTEEIIDNALKREFEQNRSENGTGWRIGVGNGLNKMADLSYIVLLLRQVQRKRWGVHLL